MNRIERNWTNKHKNTIGLTAGLVSNARVLQTSDYLAVSEPKPLGRGAPPNLKERLSEISGWYEAISD